MRLVKTALRSKVVKIGVDYGVASAQMLDHSKWIALKGAGQREKWAEIVVGQSGRAAGPGPERICLILPGAASVENALDPAEIEICERPAWKIPVIDLSGLEQVFLRRVASARCLGGQTSGDQCRA